MLSQEEGQDDQHQDEKTSQRADGSQVLFDSGVIGIEFTTAGRGGSRRTPTNLSFAFLCHFLTPNSYLLKKMGNVR
jgi:hypothetical protein